MIFNLSIKITNKYTVTNMGVNVWNKFIGKRSLIKVAKLNIEKLKFNVN